jgi:protein arginine N-methyltransferase 2
MGIVDSYIQAHSPLEHVIIEAHPGVYKKMLADGWDKKPGVRILFGRWQDVIKEIDDGTLDGIFYDTYGEHHTDLEDFQDVLPRILKTDGIYSFFNGLCPDNAFFQGVACNCVKIQLEALKFDVDFVKCQIQIKEGSWEGVRRKYWHSDEYFLPICVFRGGKKGGEGEGEGEGGEGGEKKKPRIN